MQGPGRISTGTTVRFHRYRAMEAIKRAIGVSGLIKGSTAFML
jgi:hypothetical protein